MSQRSDSPARNIPGLFLGDPSSNIRMPFDVDFRAYRVYGLFLVPTFALLWLVLPAMVTLVAFAWRFSGMVSPHLPVVWLRKRRMTGWLVGAAAVAFALLLLPSLRLWANPLAWWQALALAPLVAFERTRDLMPRIGPNTPLAYWMALLPRVAGGPRQSRPLATYSAMVIEPVDDALSEIELLALSLDPKEVTVNTALPRVTPVQYLRWDPTDIPAAAQVFTWVTSQGDGATVEGTQLRIELGNGESVVVPAGNYVVLVNGRFRSYSPQAFALTYETQS